MKVAPPGVISLGSAHLLWRARFVLALCGTGVLLSLLLFAYTAANERKRAAEAAEQTARDMALVLERHVSGAVAKADGLLRRVVDDVQSLSWEEIAGAHRLWRSYRTELRRSQMLHSVFVVDADGALRFTTTQPLPAPELNVSDREYFESVAIGAEGLQAGSPLLGRLTSEFIIPLARRLEDASGVFRGVVGVSIDADLLKTLYGEIGAPHAPLIELIRERDMAVLVSEPSWGVEPADAAELPRKAEAFARLAAGEARSMTYRVVTADGVERIGAFRRTDSAGLLVSFAVNRDAVLAQWRWEMAGPALLTGLAVTALVIIGGFGIREARAEAVHRAALEEAVRTRTAELENAVAAREALLREVNHRVKNSLTVVASLLSLQGSHQGSPEAERPFREAGARVRAVARIHERLYQSDEVDLVDLGAFLKDFCADLHRSLPHSDRIRLGVQAEPCTIFADRMIPLALSVNELVTNAFKYGFPDGREGCVQVRLARGSEELSLTVADNGIGLPLGAEAGRGLGMRLIHGFGNQLGGSVEIDRRAPGVAFIIRLPAAICSPPDKRRA